MVGRAYENKASREGFRVVVGIDEAGRGPLAGPVVAAACSLASGHGIQGIDDSKKLSSARRKELYRQLLASPAVSCAVAAVESDRIDQINILQASLDAMRLAVEKFPMVPDMLLVDGLYVPKTKIPAQAIPKGDGISESIAAASILAKYFRDQLMLFYHEQWSNYGFDRHKGYPTARHLEALRNYGPSPIHRRLYKPVRAVIEKKNLLFCKNKGIPLENG